ncbi:unnamed protein product, partial [Mesorhabditis belari]|uniref:Uncharacterized protein n=1 Tax=Mesorhabditis belari TaxID=2138241 RepID=A0AAF3J7S9_9BILA
MALSAPNFVKKQWKLGKFKTLDVYTQSASLEQILKQIRKHRSTGALYHEEAVNRQPFLMRNLGSGIQSWPKFEEQHKRFIEKQRNAHYQFTEVVTEDEEDLIIRQLKEDVARTAASHQDSALIVDEEDRVIHNMHRYVSQEIADAKQAQATEEATSRNSKDTGYGSRAASSSSSCKESDYTSESSDDDDENSTPFVPDLSTNAIKGFFRTLSAQPLRCFYTIWCSRSIMKKNRVVSKLIPELEKLSESKAVLSMINKAPKGGISGRIESLDELNPKAKHTLSLWNIVTTMYNPDSAEESGVEDGPLDKWNEQFPAKNKLTPVSHIKQRNRTPTSSERRSTPRTPVSSAAKRPKTTPVSAKNKLTPVSHIKQRNRTPTSSERRSTPRTPVSSAAKRPKTTQFQQKKLTPVSHIKQRNRTPTSSERRSTPRTPVSSGAKRPNTTPVSPERRNTPRTPVSSAAKRPNTTPVSSERKRLCRTPLSIK